MPSIRLSLVLPLLLAAAPSFLGAQTLYDDCSQPYALSIGLNPPSGSFNGASATASTVAGGCGPTIDLWFSYVATSAGPVKFDGTNAAGVIDNQVRLEVFDACGGAAIGGIAPCISGPNEALIDMFAGQFCVIRAYGNFSPNLPADFGIKVRAPANAYFTGGWINVADGINPRSPVGSANHVYTNIGSDVLSPGSLPACAPHFCPVKFVYEATATGNVAISTCTPPGFSAGTMLDSVILVYGGTFPFQLIACNDDSCGLLSSLTFPCTAGQSYEILVGSYFGTPQGTFRLTIAPPPPSNDGCAGATYVPPGPFASVDATTAGATPTLGAPANCISAGADDVYFVWTCWTTQSVSIRLAATYGAPGFVGADHVSVRHEDGCGNPAATLPGACGISVTLGAIAGTTYLIRAANTGAVPHGPFALVVDFPAPAHDEPAGALPLVSGFNPALGGGFSMVGSTQSAGIGTCVLEAQDVYFAYTAPTTGMIDVSIENPPGSFTYGLYVLEVHPTGMEAFPPTACAVSYPGGYHLAFQATAGQSYTIRVATDVYTAPFALRVTSRLELKLSSPLGASSLLIQDVGGEHGDVYINLFSLFPGNFPSGMWFGIDMTLTEVLVQIGSGAPPFIGVLDAQGAASFGPIVGLPPLTVYGVALELNPSGYIVRTSAPISYVIP